MSRFHAYLNSAQQLLRNYRGEEPFVHAAKRYFAQHKKHGSTDRKQITHLCYCYFRLGKALDYLVSKMNTRDAEDAMQEQLLAALFFCETKPHPLLEQLRPDWIPFASLPPPKKFDILSGNRGTYEELLSALTGELPALSEGVEQRRLAESFFIQPDLFLRIRPGFRQQVNARLHAAGIPFSACGEDCLALPNSSRLDQVLDLDKEAVVQDKNSQQVLSVLASLSFSKAPRCWDACAASGGKSIQLTDSIGPGELLVSDLRPSILHNLKHRFTRAGVRQYSMFTADLSRPLLSDPGLFDLVLADVPCTGSGTWGRTPEQLCFFSSGELKNYAVRQGAILKTVTQQVRPGGFLLYSTCSVFREENEERVRWVMEELGFILLEQKLFTGYDQKADSLFAALLQRPL